MTNLTNKDNIPIRTGQVWEGGDVGDRPYEIIMIRPNGRVILESDNMAWSYDPSDSIFDEICQRLIYCPTLGDMSEWRIVTDQEKREHDMPSDCCEMYYISDACGATKWISCNYAWRSGITYRVPRDWEWPVEDAPQDKRVVCGYDGCKLEPLESTKKLFGMCGVCARKHNPVGYSGYCEELEEDTPQEKCALCGGKMDGFGTMTECGACCGVLSDAPQERCYKGFPGYAACECSACRPKPRKIEPLDIFDAMRYDESYRQLKVGWQEALVGKINEIANAINELRGAE